MPTSRPSFANAQARLGASGLRRCSLRFRGAVVLRDTSSTGSDRPRSDPIPPLCSRSGAGPRADVFKRSTLLEETTYNNILLAAELQQWERYSVHAVAARDVAGTLAREAKRLHVLSVYEHGPTRVPTSGLPAEAAAQLREQHIEQTDRQMVEKMDEYVGPLFGQGLPISKILRVGSPRHVIVAVASEVEA